MSSGTKIQTKTATYYDIYDFGYDTYLVKTDSFYDNTGIKDKTTETVSPIYIGSGELTGNQIVTDGYIKSDNYELGVSGWFLGPDSAQLPATSIVGDLTSSNYSSIIPYAGYKLEASTGYGYFNQIVIKGGTINSVDISNIANAGNSTPDSVPTGLAISSTGVTVANDGTVSAYVILTWTVVSSSTFDHYQIRFKKHSYTYYFYIDSSINTITIDGLVPNTSYDFAISSVNKYGISSAFSSTVTSTSATNSGAPATVTIGSATAGIQYNILEWTHNTDTDLASYNIYRNTTNDSGTAILIGNVRTNYFVDGGRTGGQIYYYWIKAVNTSGVVSTSFSSVISATPRNVENTDVTSISAAKILINGVVYLSNWQKSGDLTKIDGGSISANSVTTTQLNFTPVQSTNVIASINASAEGITIDADNLTISAATTFSSGYNPTEKTAKVGGTYDSSIGGARIRIFPDSNTAIQITDGSGNDVFKCLIGGTNIGDVIIGNYAGNQGMYYDKSAVNFDFKGSMTAGTITGTTITGSLFQTAATGSRTTLNQVAGYDYGLVTFDSSENTCHALYPDGRTNSNYFGSNDMLTYYLRDSLNTSSSPSIMVLEDQAIITDGGTQTHNGYNFGVVSYYPLVFGNATKTGSGTLGIGRHWAKNDIINQAVWSGTLSGYDFCGTNAGTSAKSYKVEIDGTGSPNTFRWSDSGGSSWNASGVAVEQGPAGSEIGGGIPLTSSDGSTVYIYFDALTGGVSGDYWTFTAGAYSASSGQVAYLAQLQKINTSAVLHLLQNSPTSTNFYKMIRLQNSSQTRYVWMSNGNTPNGALSGTAGDICLNCDSGKAYYCTGTTNWTAM